MYMNLVKAIETEMYRRFIPFKNVEWIEMYAKEAPNAVDPKKNHYYIDIITVNGNTYTVNGTYGEIYQLHRAIVGRWQEWLQSPKYAKFQGIWEIYGIAGDEQPVRKFSTSVPAPVMSTDFIGEDQPTQKENKGNS